MAMGSILLVRRDSRIVPQKRTDQVRETKLGNAREGKGGLASCGFYMSSFAPQKNKMTHVFRIEKRHEFIARLLITKECKLERPGMRWIVVLFGVVLE